jgi:low temperature requirement protein LtrA
MGKNRDLLKVIILILLGMFIPFLGSITFTYGFEIRTIVVTFLYFLVIFGLELGVVYLYFTFSGRRANKKMQQYRPK